VEKGEKREGASTSFYPGEKQGKKRCFPKINEKKEKKHPQREEEEKEEESLFPYLSYRGEKKKEDLSYFQSVQ